MLRSNAQRALRVKLTDGNTHWLQSLGVFFSLRSLWRFAESTLEALRITSSDPETTALPRPGIAEVVECVYFYTGDKQNAVIVLFCIDIY